MDKNKKTKAVLGLVLGILSIPTAFIPLFGVPVGVAGLILSIKGIKQSQGMAIAGLVCSIIGLFLSAINALFGAYLAAIGENELVNALFSK